MKDGADGVEFDVRLCRDGSVVVFHDSDLVRLVGRPERIDALDAAAVRAIRLTSGVGIPTLPEVLQVVAASRLINVEIKVDRAFDPRLPAFCKRIAGDIEKAGVGERVIVSSFSQSAVSVWRRTRPDIRMGFLFEPEMGKLMTHLLVRWLGPDAVHPHHSRCTPSAVARWKKQGKGINVWTVDDPERVRTLASLGVDAIISNDPAAARRALSVQ
jgi:glycerophosphoryl diester phosphodiesterase